MNKSRKTTQIFFVAIIILFMALLSVRPVAAATSASVEFSVAKQLYGDVPSDKAVFHVVLTAQDDATPMPDGQMGGTNTLAVEASGENRFGLIDYTKEGIFYYTIHEQDDGVTGYTYDQDVFDVTVYVTADQAGALTAKVIIAEKSTGVKTNDIVFWNGFEKTSDSEKDSLQISKNVIGNAPENDTFQMQVFIGTDTERTYVYSDAKGNKQGVLKYGDYINLKAGQTIQIENITKGTDYKIIETQKAYYTPAPITGVITGLIDTGINEAAFTNTYDTSTPAPLSVDPPIQKQVAGVGAPTDTVFRFKFEGSDENTPMPEGSEGRTKILQITGAGDTDAGYITYTKPGVYKYTMSEINDKVPGYTYDKEIYTMTVTVTDEDGKLQAVRGFRNTAERDVKQMIFTNHFANLTEVVSTPAETGPVSTTEPGKLTATPTSGVITSGDGGGTTTRGSASSSNVISRFIQAVKTADPTQLAGYVILAAGAVVIIILAIKKRKNREDE